MSNKPLTINKLLKYFLILLVLPVYSCSLTSRSDSDNPEVKNVLIDMSSIYFISIANGNFKKISELISWEEYIPNKDNALSREGYFEQLSKLDGRYTIETHPILKVKVEDISINGNDAKIIFTKNDSPDIELKFMWSGSAWLIVDDNLFGNGGIFEKLKSISDEQKAKPDRVRQKQLDKKDLAVP